MTISKCGVITCKYEVIYECAIVKKYNALTTVQIPLGFATCNFPVAMPFFPFSPDVMPQLLLLSGNFACWRAKTENINFYISS